ncbi:hypothetical protein ACFXG1_33010 [Streptomyces sp. NPDC059248]|uniref:hypothetical protein n=1 Tax=Streptomyces sp. NPDC059248 TaxID=3346791 RepID=UPI0036D1A882
MSGTRSTEEGGTRRRSPLIASLVAAVLVAGGGSGLYLAVADSPDGGDRGASARGSGGGGQPPKIRTESALADAPGIAPGEPGPLGSVLERGKGVAFPDGPDEAAVHRTGGGPAAADATRVAKAFGLTAPPRLAGGMWRSGPDADGTGGAVEVGSKAPGSWSYGAHAGTDGGDNCESTTVCTDRRGPATPSGTPVSDARARQAAAPVLKALGRGDAVVDARATVGADRIVTADPLIDGVRTQGYATRLVIGPDGRVVRATGFASVPEKRDTYPLIPADEALKEANKATLGGVGRGQDGPSACATSMPLGGGGDDAVTTDRPESAGCGPAKPVPQRLAVTGAVIGLTAVHGDGEVTFVPAWLFRVAPHGGGTDFTHAQPAVEKRFLDDTPAPPPGGGNKPPSDDGGDASPPASKPAPTGSAVTTYRADGRTLSLTFFGGVCESYRASARESGGSVRVSVVGTWNDPGKACIAIAKEQTVKVALDAPLGDRKVVDAATGETVPRS